MIFRFQKNCIFCWSSKNGNYILQSLNHVDIYLKLGFLIKSSYHIVRCPSTALRVSILAFLKLKNKWQIRQGDILFFSIFMTIETPKFLQLLGESHYSTFNHFVRKLWKIHLDHCVKLCVVFHRIKQGFLPGLKSNHFYWISLGNPRHYPIRQ